MYNTIESTVINNGNTSWYFKLERGVRQGCRLSAYLFILAIEILENKIRYEKNITGLNIDNKIIRLTLVANDLTLILKDLLSVENGLKLLSFSNCSRLKINIDKRKVKSIGRSLTPDHYPHGLSWIKIPLETLGIYITNKHDDNLNTLALSLLIYASNIIESPPEAFKEINDIIQTFICEGKTAKMAENT